MPPTPRHPAAVILAAGKGTRMKSDLPKVVHPIGGRPMVCAVVEACKQVGCAPIVAVVGYQQEKVRAALGGFGVEFAVQEPQLGTGHAVQCAAALLEEPPRSGGVPKSGPDRDVFILCGDGPLIRAETLRSLLERHRASKADATLATAVIDDPTGYGRIVRDGRGKFEKIVEHKNATEAQRAIREVNPSYYCFKQSDLLASLKDVKRNEASGEYYLTDVLSLLPSRGKTVEVVPSVPPEDVLSINTPEDLAMVDAVYRKRSGAAAPKKTPQGAAR